MSAREPFAEPVKRIFTIEAGDFFDLLKNVRYYYKEPAFRSQRKSDDWRPVFF